MSGRTNYSPFKKCTFSHLLYFPCPAPNTPALSPSLRLLDLISGPLESHSQGDKQALLPVISQNELCSDSKRTAVAAVAVGVQAPKIPGNILLWCSLKTCGIPAHNAFVEFPKWI